MLLILTTLKGFKRYLESWNTLGRRHQSRHPPPHHNHPPNTPNHQVHLEHYRYIIPSLLRFLQSKWFSMGEAWRISWFPNSESEIFFFALGFKASELKPDEQSSKITAKDLILGDSQLSNWWKCKVQQGIYNLKYPPQITKKRASK